MAKKKNVSNETNYTQYTSHRQNLLMYCAKLHLSCIWKATNLPNQGGDLIKKKRVRTEDGGKPQGG